MKNTKIVFSFSVDPFETPSNDEESVLVYIANGTYSQLYKKTVNLVELNFVLFHTH